MENVIDRGLANRGYTKEEEIRTLMIQAMPDTGVWALVINEDTRQKLGLAIEEISESTLADGRTEGVKIQWKNRSTVLPAVVVPNAKDILLGALTQRPEPTCSRHQAVLAERRVGVLCNALARLSKVYSVCYTKLYGG